MAENRLCARRRLATAKTEPGAGTTRAFSRNEKGSQAFQKLFRKTFRTNSDELPRSSVGEIFPTNERPFDCVADFLARVFAIALAPALRLQNWYQRTIANAS
jgi:hypothetical protein